MDWSRKKLQQQENEKFECSKGSKCEWKAHGTKDDSTEMICWAFPFSFDSGDK